MADRQKGGRVPGSVRDRAWSDYSATFREQVFPHLMSAHVCLSMVGGDPLNVTADVVQAATEIGYILMLGKPLILLVAPGQTIPPKLRAAATVVLDDYLGVKEDDERLRAAFATATATETPADAPGDTP